MIITRTPLRISIGGGGTDLPSYYQRFGGFLISGAINRYIYIALHRTFVNNYIIKYSQMETVENLADIKHPIVREAFRLHDVKPYIEMASMADIPAGTGLGSSGAFNVGLLRAIYALKREHITTQALAEEACHIELDLLKEPIGKQDQYIAAFGGLTCMEFQKDGTVNVSPLRITTDTLNDLEDNLLMFFTNYSRSASNVLKDQKTRSEKDDKAMLDNLHFVKDLGYSIKKALEAGDTHEFARLMHQHWLHKKERSQGISNEQINRWYDIGYGSGALGGKLIGAGGGGFLMFYAHDRAALRRAMAKEGLIEVRFAFDHEGSMVVNRD
ncbi:MAG: galactokinase [Oligoflexia bacterium]|nr:galactokinase [Oligoflexia bacterium]